MKYPWVFLAITGVWFSTLALMILKKNVLNPTGLYLFGSLCVLIVFFIGFKSK